MSRVDFSPLLLLVDAPAHSAVRLGRAPLWRTIGLALVGAIVVAASTFIGAAIVTGHFDVMGGTATSVAFGWLESLAIVVPSAMLLFTYADLDFDARTTLAAVAIGLVTSGVVVVGVLPLLAYLSVMTVATPLVTFDALPPIVAFLAFAATFGRIGTAVDPTVRGVRLVHITTVVLIAAFLMRAVSRTSVLAHF